MTRHHTPVAVIPTAEYEGRLRAVRHAMAVQGVAGLLITSPENICYLVGLNHQGYFAFTMLIVPSQGAPWLVTRLMERPTVAAHAPGVGHIGFADGEDPAVAVMSCVKDLGLDTEALGVELDHMFFPPRTWQRIRDGLSGVAWQDSSGTVEDLRLVKSPAELAAVRQAGKVSHHAMQAGIQTTGVGVNERDVAAAIARALILAGGEHPGFAPLVRGTEVLGEEHTTWRDRVLRPGDRLFIELSGSVHRYHAPMARIVNIGAPAEEVVRAETAARVGLEAIIGALAPGVFGGDVYAAWEQAVARVIGTVPPLRHHCGYSVGIGFPPSWVGGSVVTGLRPGGQLLVQEGMVFHALSWLTGPVDYVVSDTVVVTASGGEALTPDRALIVR